MPRAAPEIGDRRTVFSLLGKAGQQSPVEPLSCELVAEALQVLLGDSVITLADSVVLRDWPVHTESLHRLPLASEQIPAGHPQFIGDRCHIQESACRHLTNRNRRSGRVRRRIGAFREPFRAGESA
jgi:hypothetical protein